MSSFNYQKLLAYSKKQSMTFSQFIDKVIESPEQCLRTSSSLISEAIGFFGYRIVVRSGEPAISYNIFEDPFSKGINAVFGQEYCIKQIVNVIDSVGRESGPNRGIVLVGPPASGKTNIIDLIGLALEEYTKQNSVKLYSFYFLLANGDGPALEIRSPFLHNPILLLPTILAQDKEIIHPRQEFLDFIGEHSEHKDLSFPSYFQHASLDRHSLDIIQALWENPRNTGMSISDIIDSYVRVEEIEFSNAQARGIANIDDLNDMPVKISDMQLGGIFQQVLSEHLPGMNLWSYQGASVYANRGLLHIHDAFTHHQNKQEDGSTELCKPLLMLLGSGKASVESTQVSIDTTVVMTTNIDEFNTVERQFTSTKLLDRIEKIPVNYLLDANSEMDILRRDLANMRERYDVDPNLLRIAAYYAVLTRLMPPKGHKLPLHYSEDKKELFMSITPEQKLFIYAAQSDDPIATIRKLPFWHPFRNEAMKLGIDINEPDSYADKIDHNKDRVTLEASGLFSSEQLKRIDDEFMRRLWNEHYPYEGMHGISVRQLQNIMRNTIAHSDGTKIHVGIFLSQLKLVFSQGPSVHHWLKVKHAPEEKPAIKKRYIGDREFAEGEGGYGDYKGLVQVVRSLYYAIIKNEIVVSAVDRDPAQIEADLRRYIQHALLAKANANKAFSHIMIPKFTYVDEKTGVKVEQADEAFMQSIEDILLINPDVPRAYFREEIAQRFLDFQEKKDIRLKIDATIISSHDDGVITCYANEYNRLLSHRKTVEGLDTQKLQKAFINKRNDPLLYENTDPSLKEIVETILDNLCSRFNYSRPIALDTIIFAIRKNVVNFKEMIS
jgi:predicted Ser/Thr protein kinase